MQVHRWFGRLFHNVGPYTENDLDAKVFILVGGISSCISLSSDLSPGCFVFLRLIISCRYFGAFPCSNLCSRLHILQFILPLIRSQCRVFRHSVALVLYDSLLRTTLAAVL